MQRSMKQVLAVMLLCIYGINCRAQQEATTIITKNEMSVGWHYANNRIFLEIGAPTNGWVAIGFNKTKKITDTYLVMGRVSVNRAQVVEHYTLAPGTYRPITVLGGKTQVDHVEGLQKQNNTLIRFSLPTKALSKYQKNLSKGTKYVMILAYSQEDDFQHHSVMRTSINVEL